ncbi:diaminopimelate decarboxylase [bacterium]|nr:diaminopimelate decarboxylase [bacterium]
MKKHDVPVGELRYDDVSLAEVAAAFGTPVYVYSHETILEKITLLKSVFSDVDVEISFAVKANNNIALLKILKEQGIGVDVVSLGELKAVLKAGFMPAQIIFNGNGKTRRELESTIAKNIFAINVDSKEEFDTIAEIAGATAAPAIRLFLRINPDIDSHTHPYISTGKKINKFGMSFDVALGLLKKAERTPGVDVAGLHFHIGSQLLDIAPYAAVVKKVEKFLETCREFSLPFLNLGGGWGIDYRKTGNHFPVDTYKAEILPVLKRMGKRYIVEMGRYLLGESGVLIGSVILNKSGTDRNFIITDIGMNDILRPSLYVAYHHIEPVRQYSGRERITADIVGPLCETGDKLAENYTIQRIEPGEYIAVMDTGAYGYSMSSNYNFRLRPPEVLLKEGRMIEIRPRETYERLLDY